MWMQVVQAMSKALDNMPSLQKLVEEWKEEDIEIVLSMAGDIIDSSKATKSQILFARFASLGAIYVQARRMERNLT